MHWIADLLAAIGVVLNGIPQGIMAMGLGFAVFPTTFSFVLASAVNGAFGSVAPISFQAESLALPETWVIQPANEPQSSLVVRSLWQ